MKTDENEVYIDYLNKDKKFQKDTIHFKNYEIAKVWALENLEKFDPDMIKYNENAHKRT